VQNHAGFTGLISEHIYSYNYPYVCWRNHLKIRDSIIHFMPLVLFAILGTSANAAAPSPPLPTFANVVYGSIGGQNETMDVYLPRTTTGSHPCVVLVHGGGWFFGDKSFYTTFASELASDGYVAASINYRMLPKWPYPAELDDTQLAVRYLRAHATEYHIDSARFGAVGDSAGGYLVAMLGLRGTRDKSLPLSQYSSRVQAVFDLYGPTDFTVDPATTPLPKEGIAIVQAFLHATQTENPALYKSSSPITYVSPAAAPFLIVHGSSDDLVPFDQSVRLAKALAANKVSVTLLAVAGAPHGFLNSQHPGIFEAMAARFFDEHLKHTASVP
jgi:acetyl esterase/lipase